MIHVLTVHYKTLDWIPVQRDYLQAHLKNYKVWSFIDKVDFSPWPFDFKFHSFKKSGIQPEGSRGHSLKLDLLAKNLEGEEDDDIIIFLDGDAIPIMPLNEFLETTLQDYEFISVVREELGHKFPHPSFACCKLGFWKKHGLSWRVKVDTGGWLQGFLEEGNIKWKRLKRTASISWHPVMFGVYGGIIYHHTASFGACQTRWDRRNPKLTKPPEERKQDSLDLFENIKDVNFFKRALQ